MVGAIVPLEKWGSDMDANKTELEELRDNLDEVKGHVVTVKRPVTSARETVEDVEDILGVFGDIKDRADNIEDSLDGLAKLSKTVAKIPVQGVAVAANNFSNTLENLAARVRTFEAKADNLDKKINGQSDDSGLKTTILVSKSTLLGMEGALSGVEFSVESLRNGVDGVIETRSAIERFANLTGRPEIVDALDEKSRGVNASAAQINRDYAETIAAANQLNIGIEDPGVVTTVTRIQGALETIANELAFLRSPLALLQTIIKPFEWALNAAEAVYNVTVKPVLDPILSALGIDKLLQKASDFIAEKLLGDINLKIVDEADAYISAVADKVNVDLPDSLIGQFQTPFERFTGAVDGDGIVGNLLSPFDLNAAKGAPTETDDVIIVSFGIAGDTIRALGGDDFVRGSDQSETIEGGAGDDVLFGAAGDDAIYGGITPASVGGTPSSAGNDAAIYIDALANYDITPDGTDDHFTIKHVSPRFGADDDGEDEVWNVKTFVFDDFDASAAFLRDIQKVLTADPYFGTSGANLIFGRREGTNDDFNDVIYGHAEGDPANDGGDYIAGLGGNDILFGGAGDDLLDGGDGSDTIYGGDGSDTASFASMRFPTLVVGESYRGVSLSLDDSLHGIENVTDTLFEIENLIGSQFDDTLLADNAANLVSGGTGDDLIFTYGGDDEVDGGEGDDQISTGAGDDLAIGGAGDDFFWAAQGDDFYDGGEGVDTLSYGGGDGSDPIVEISIDVATRTISKSGGADVDRFINVEKITATSNRDVLSIAAGVIDNLTIDGGDGDDELSGSGSPLTLSSGVALHGGAGNDTIYVTDYEWSYDGGDGVDIIDFSQSSVAGWEVIFQRDIGLPTRHAMASARFIEGLEDEYLRSIGAAAPPLEELLVNVDDFEILIGSHGDDLLSAAGGTMDVSRTLLGGDGDDELRAGVKAAGVDGDVLDGGAGDDELFAATNAENQNIHGGDGDDVLYAEGSSANASFVELHGDAGDDRFVIRSESRQTLQGGDGFDVVDYYSQNATAGRTTRVFVDLALGGELDFSQLNQATPVFALDPNGDRYFDVEAIWGSSGADELYGDDGANLILGGGDKNRDSSASQDEDIIDGRGGDDVIYGHDGNDTIFGGDGDDLIHGGEGGDRIDGGTGVDTVSYAGFVGHADDNQRFREYAIAGVDIDLVLGTANPKEETGIDTISNVENVIGSIGGDSIAGDAQVNRLNGTRGDDVIDGREGDDIVIGGDGDDALTGGLGADRIYAGAGADAIFGDGPLTDASIDILDYSGNAGGVTVTMSGAGAGTVEESTIVDAPYWEDLDGPAAVGATDGRTWTPNAGVEQAITPREIYEIDPLYANDTNDLEREKPNIFKRSAADLPLQISVGTQVELTTDTFEGIEIIVGGAGDDIFNGAAAGDAFEGGAGNDALSGGAGVDTARYRGALSEYRFRYDAASDTLTIAHTPPAKADGDETPIIDDGVDAVTDFEQFVFSAGAASETAVSRDDLIALSAAQEASNRAPDVPGVQSGGAVSEIATAGTVVATIGSVDLDGDRLTFAAVSPNPYLELVGDQIRIKEGVELDFERDETVTLEIVATDMFGATSAIGAISITLEDVANVYVHAGGGVFRDLGVNEFSITGSEQGETLLGLFGDDVLDGLGGDDLVRGGTGSDTVLGGAGDDIVSGDRGDDVVRGGDGVDIVRGGAGDDVVYGGAGDDERVSIVSGDAGDDFVFGGDGVDKLRGGADDDVLDGGAGGDRVVGDRGNDLLLGGRGDDALIGGQGDDMLQGGEGDDTLVGDFPNLGGVDRGADTFVFQQGGGVDIVRDFVDGEDLLDVSDFQFSSAESLLENAVERSDGVRLIFDDGVEAILRSITIGQLDNDDFIFG